ncbi:MAG: ATP-binding protein [Acidimicrobiales bacterium]
MSDPAGPSSRPDELARVLDGLKAVARALVRGDDGDAVLAMVAGLGVGLIGADLATVATPGPAAGTMTVRVAEGLGGPGLLGTTFAAAGSAAATVMATGSPLLVAEVADDPAVRGAGMAAGLFLPVGDGAGAVGALALARRAGSDAFHPGDLALAEVVAAQAAVVLHHAEVQADVGRLSRLEDHERIAMDLHDGVVQTLFAVGLTIEAIAQAEVLADGRGGVRSRLLAAASTIDGAIADLRGYIAGLHPPEAPAAAPPGTLAGDLVELVESFRGSGPARITVEVDPLAASLLKTRETEILQVAREALSNAVRHSGAATIGLRFVARPEDVVLEVTDDGHGFDPDTVRRGRGLSNLRSRAESLGGVFRLEAAPGRGTTAQIIIPA